MIFLSSVGRIYAARQLLHPDRLSCHFRILLHIQDYGTFFLFSIPPFTRRSDDIPNGPFLENAEETGLFRRLMASHQFSGIPETVSETFPHLIHPEPAASAFRFLSTCISVCDKSFLRPSQSGGTSGRTLGRISPFFSVYAAFRNPPAPFSWIHRRFSPLAGNTDAP